jgi:hypothetical protein
MVLEEIGVDESAAGKDVCEAETLDCKADRVAASIVALKFSVGVGEGRLHDITASMSIIPTKANRPKRLHMLPPNYFNKNG